MPKKKTVITLLLIAVVALGIVLLAMRGGGGRKVRTVSQSSPAKGEVFSSEKTTFTFLGRTIPLEEEKWMNTSTLLGKEPIRDPFAILIFSRKEPSAPREPEIKKTLIEVRQFPTIELKAIIIGGEESIAVVGEEMVSVGSKIGEEEVLAIKEDRILVGSGGYQREVLLTKGGGTVSIIKHSSKDFSAPKEVTTK